MHFVFQIKSFFVCVLPSGISGFDSRFIVGLNYHLLKVMILHIGMSDGNAQSLSLRVSAWVPSLLVPTVPGEEGV